MPSQARLVTPNVYIEQFSSANGREPGRETIEVVCQQFTRTFYRQSGDSAIRR